MKSATICPFTAVHGQYCTSNSLSSIAHKAILSTTSGLLMALLPFWETMKPKNFLAVTPNTHLLGFSFMLYDRKVSNVS